MELRVQSVEEVSRKRRENRERLDRIRKYEDELIERIQSGISVPTDYWGKRRFVFDLEQDARKKEFMALHFEADGYLPFKCAEFVRSAYQPLIDRIYREIKAEEDRRRAEIRKNLGVM